MALDAAILVLQSGGATVAAERTFSNVLKGYGKESVRVLWRLDFVALAADSVAIVRPVGPVGTNLSRASQAMVLADRLAGGSIAVEDFPAQLERIKGLNSSYNRGAMVAAAASSAVSYRWVPP